MEFGLWRRFCYLLAAQSSLVARSKKGYEWCGGLQMAAAVGRGYYSIRKITVKVVKSIVKLETMGTVLSVCITKGS